MYLLLFVFIATCEVYFITDGSSTLLFGRITKVRIKKKKGKEKEIRYNIEALIRVIRVHILSCGHEICLLSSLSIYGGSYGSTNSV